MKLVTGNGIYLHVMDEIAPVTLGIGKLELHVFLDKCVPEIFVNEGEVCLTYIVQAAEDDEGIAAFAEGGEANLASLDVWEMRPIYI